LLRRHAKEGSEGLGILEATNVADVTKDTGYRRRSQARNASNKLGIIF
jgi:hypothetical protein